MPKTIGLSCALAAATLAVAFGALDARAEPAPSRDFKSYQPTARATRVGAAEAPKIDGDVSDAVWTKAQAIDEFYQLEPAEGQPGSERTVVRVLYDDANIYVSVYCYDSDPSGIKATIKARDGQVAKDDVIRLYFDPHMTRRDGYAFEINPLGGRLDELIQNNNAWLPEWNTIWDAKARIVADGYTIEVAIPFRSLSFDPNRSEWGFDFLRVVRRKNERIRWSSIDNSRPSVDISHSGTLTGITGSSQGIGLEIKAFGTANYKHEWEAPRDDDIKIEPSGNLYYKITPSLTGTLTFNTDFSDTPLDERKVNTSRFGLFFPETRDFFLQDAAVFEFGGSTLDNSVNGRPFFSRNIGLVDGEPAQIIAGGKLSGQLEGISVGGLAVKTEGTGLYDGQILSVMRLNMPVFEESKIGVIMTNGDPTGLSRNTVAGGDFQFRNSTWIDGKQLAADFMYERSFSNISGDDDAFSVHLRYPNEPWSGRIYFKEIGENFDPALGFVNRPGIRMYDGNTYYHPTFQDSWLRWMETGTWFLFITDLDDRLQSRENGWWIGGFTNEGGDLAFLNVWNAFERVDAPFDLPRNVTVDAGEYTWTNASLHIETAFRRELSFTADIECCTFFNGDYLYTYLYANWRPNSTFDIGASQIFQNINLPSGDLQIQIYALDLGINFTPDMAIRAQGQYDNISQAFGMSVRYRWEFAPGSEFFAALGESADIVGTHYSSQTSQGSVRIGHTMRF